MITEDNLGWVLGGIILFMVIAMSFATVRLIKSIRAGKPLYGPNITKSRNQILEAMEPKARFEAMQKAIRSWAWTAIAIGGIAVFAGQTFSAPWGIIQILIGLLSFFFHSDYAMFIIYAGVFAWAGTLNVISGAGMWSFFGLIQFYWAYATYRQFRLYQSAAQALKQGAASTSEQAVSPDAPPPLWAKPDEEDSRASRFFPWLALGLSGFGFAVVMMLFISVAANRYIHLFNEVPGWYNFGFEVGLLISIIGVPFGVSSLFSGYSRKAASILAIVVGTLMTAAYLWLRIMGSG